MSVFGSKTWRRQGLAFTTALLLLLVSAIALAAGRIEWGNKTLKPRSDNQSWNIEIAIFLPKPPDVPSVPMRFIFEEKVAYERSIEDGDKHTTRKVPLEGKQPIIESVDVGFLDPRSGKIENRTKFTFKLHRDHGFECGEYKVTVRDARNDVVVGQPTTLIFGGENEEVDRRSVVFTGEKKKKKEKPAGSPAGDSASADGASDTSEKKADDASAEKADTRPALETPPEETNQTADAEEIKKKPGGCGCTLPGEPSSTGAAWAGLLAGAALLLRRRMTAK
jgi:MYXO-CTERM domain-containing protein